MNPILLSGSDVVTFADGQTERDARLLVAGNYPAKGLTVTEGDIDSLVANFSGPVPVKVEHIDTPLDPLGLVQRVWRDGSALMGRVHFPAEMGAFLAKRGAAKLSVGLLKEPAWKLLEASLTHTPHVPTATLLSEGPHPPAPSPNSGRGGDGVELSEAGMAELVQLRAERMEGQITALKAAGKLLPANEAAARALLGTPGVVTLSDGTVEPASAVFLRFLEGQPPVVQFGERARAQEGVRLSGGASGVAASTEMDDEGQFSPEEREVLRRLGADPAEVRKTMTNDKMNSDKKTQSKGGMQ